MRLIAKFAGDNFYHDLRSVSINNLNPGAAICTRESIFILISNDLALNVKDASKWLIKPCMIARRFDGLPPMANGLTHRAKLFCRSGMDA